MQYTQIVSKAKQHYEAGISFVLFALPGEKLLKAAFQNEANAFTTKSFIDKSFVMAPFGFDGELLQIPFSEASFFEVPLPATPTIKNATPPLDEEDADKKRYMEMVQKAISKIKSGVAQKIVLSREKRLTLSNFSIEQLCEELFKRHKNAFRYIWYHPTSGLWCGATPEVLLETEGLNFKTMALAGTQKVNDQKMLHWSGKERREQQWVTDAIIKSLENRTSVLKVSKTQTHVAGNIAHLRTDVSGVLNTTRATLTEITNALHPTPAVCGTPRTAALKFIQQHEGYNRSYYTGFLGPVCEAQRCSKLFVNLRCMSISDQTATLYAGGGITVDSVAEDEWEETHNKLATMAKVIQPLL